ncbi:acyl carrier protein [Streptomyces chartreusis]
MNRTEAMDMVKESLTRVIPGADVAALGPDDAFRDVLEMDSLDFLSFVEVLSERSGIRIEDEDASRLVTMAAGADFLVAAAQ